ncbi:MAG: hypothetical protein C5B60_03880 [Chloroflexi bacterium]|nr:MAG: hypothetical protein C5B60_03880 [Chloroflexota bacterium]
MHPRYPYAKSSWFECAICGEEFPQFLAQRHYKFGALVDLKCADELAHSDFYERLRLPDTDRPNPTQQRVHVQGPVVPVPAFEFNKSHFNDDTVALTPGPRSLQEPQ